MCSGVVVSEDPALWPRVEPAEVRAFVERCMLAVGTRAEDAGQLAELLADADQRGHYSHGANRLDVYVGDIQSGTTISDRAPAILKETIATAWVDGQSLLGPVVGKFCMDLAIQKAKEAGIGWVVAKGSNHYGIAGWYSTRACQHGLVGMSFTNASPLLVPTRAKRGILGTNPISVAAPANLGDSFVLDMATSTVAIGKIEVRDRKGVPLPRGWACDASGQETTDSQKMYAGGGILPLGGVEETGGYKGYGLAMMVEIFCGILGGAAFGDQIRKWKSTDRPADLGQCFVAIDPDAFAPGFQERLSDFLSMCRDQQPMEGADEVLVPGDPERANIKRCETMAGIPYHPNQLTHLDQIAAELGVAPPVRTHPNNI